MTNAASTEPVSSLEREVDALAAAALACPAVAGLDSGGWHQVATYLPGRRVTGVRVEDERVVVSVVLALGTSVPTLEAQLRTALAPSLGGRRLDIIVSDVAPRAPALTAEPAAASGNGPT